MSEKKVTGEMTDLISHLDFTVEVECICCPAPATRLVAVTPGPDECLHDQWYAMCEHHQNRAFNGHVRCTGCNETAIAHTSKSL